jgi:hypothetical protein
LILELIQSHATVVDSKALRLSLMPNVYCARDGLGHE